MRSLRTRKAAATMPARNAEPSISHGSGSDDSDGDAEPGFITGRCGRTDGRMWRCSQKTLPGTKYCEKHMHRGCRRKKLLDDLTSKLTPKSSFATSKLRAAAAAPTSSPTKSSSMPQARPQPKAAPKSKACDVTVSTPPAPAAAKRKRKRQPEPAKPSKYMSKAARRASYDSSKSTHCNESFGHISPEENNTPNISSSTVDLLPCAGDEVVSQPKLVHLAEETGEDMAVRSWGATAGEYREEGGGLFPARAAGRTALLDTFSLTDNQLLMPPPEQLPLAYRSMLGWQEQGYQHVQQYHHQLLQQQYQEQYHMAAMSAAMLGGDVTGCPGAFDGQQYQQFAGAGAGYTGFAEPSFMLNELDMRYVAELLL